MELVSIAIEFDFMNPSVAARHLVNLTCQCWRNKAREGRLDADSRQFFALERHHASRIGKGSW
jgi:hypothetical protein